MVSTLLFLTFLSMAFGAPQQPTSRQFPDDATEDLRQDADYGDYADETLKDKVCKDCKGEDGGDYTDFPSRLNLVEKNSPSQMPVRAAAPPPEDLLGYYIFTTYHLLLKEFRNNANGTEIVALRSQGPPKSQWSAVDPNGADNAQSSGDGGVLSGALTRN